MADEDSYRQGDDDEGVTMTPQPKGLFGGGKKVANGMRAAPLPLATAGFDEDEEPLDYEAEPVPTSMSTCSSNFQPARHSCCSSSPHLCESWQLLRTVRSHMRRQPR